MKNVLILIGLFMYVPTYAQMQRGYNWITGLNGNRINFSPSIVTTFSGNYVNKYFHGGNSCISDSNGNLLLASNGLDIYDKTGVLFYNGDSIIPKSYYDYSFPFNSGSQNSIFLPIDSDLYYFITPTFSNIRFADCIANNNCHYDLLLYSIIDMKVNSGAGQVIERMIPIVQQSQLRKTQMMACKHGNGKDWWLLKNEGDSGNVHTFLFTQDSVYDKGVQTFNEPVWGGWDLHGQSTFNIDGSLFATTSDGSGSLTSLGLVFVSNFDRCYGILSSPRVIDMPWGSEQNPNDTSMNEKQSVGLCFSPNSQFLYVISKSNVYQYDLSDNTWFHVAGIDTSFDWFMNYETSYLGPDNKIYIGNFGGSSKQMSRIDNPNVKGAGCSFCPRCFRMDSLSGAFYVGTPPCMPNYGLGAKTCFPLDTPNMNLSNDVEIFPNPAFTLINIKNGKGKVKDLYNGMGQIIFSTTKDEIDISSLSNGMYYLKCEGQSKKVIIK